MKIQKLNNWIKSQKRSNVMKVHKVGFNIIKGWGINPSEIFNKKKKFFSIRPYQFINQNKKKWYQPLIIQKEVGILGIIKRRVNKLDYYLLQAKIEPGNIDNIQLSPTVQATKSNYLRAHGGRKTKYLQFFIKKNNSLKVLTNLRLSEQGTRYFDKSNKNILVEIKKQKIQKNKNFIWLSKKDLIYLIKKKNLLNMDSISVFSSSIKKAKVDNPINDFNEIIKKYKYFTKKFYIRKKKVLFKNMKGWKILNKKIHDIKKNFFSIICLKVETNSREVNNWSQPIISDHSSSFNGFLCKNVNKTNHYLLRCILEPGFKKPKFTTTVIIKNFSYSNKKDKYLKFFRNKKNISLDVINSDEGGRFFKNETRNMIAFLKNKNKLILSKDYIWVSHNQLVELINKNLLSIEARNLFASFNIDKIK